MDRPTSFRIPPPLRARLEAMRADPPAAVAARGRVNLAEIMREAMIRGLEQMEREKREERQEG